MHIELELNKGRAGRLLIDGVDITDNVLAAGIDVQSEDVQSPRITVTLAPDRLTVRGDMSIDLRHDTAGQFADLIEKQEHALRRLAENLAGLEAAVERGARRGSRRKPPPDGEPPAGAPRPLRDH